MAVMTEGLTRHEAADGSIMWSTPRATEKPFVIRIFALPSEKIFRCDAPENAGAIAECSGEENQEVNVEPGSYNVVGGDWRTNYLHVIEVGADGSIKEKTGLWSDALKNNMFGGDLSGNLQ